MNKYLKVIMSKMCSYVGVKVEDINLKDENWFLKHEWTGKQEDEFLEWMIDYLIKHPKAQRELYGSAGNKTLNTKRAAIFIFAYGWKTQKC